MSEPNHVKQLSNTGRAVAKSAHRRVLRGDQPLSGGLGVSPNLISPRRRRQDDFATALVIRVGFRGRLLIWQNLTFLQVLQLRRELRSVNRDDQLYTSSRRASRAAAKQICKWRPPTSSTKLNRRAIIKSCRR